MEKFWHNTSKYSQWYFNMMQRCQKLQRSKKENYFENHHIQPECLGGKRIKANMVLLTAREHIIAHRLLIRMFTPRSKEWTSMVFAFKRMIDAGKNHKGERQSIINSRHLAERKSLHGLAMSIRMRGKSMPDHVRKKISASHTGKTLSNEHKESISMSLKQTLSSAEQKAKISSERKSRIYKDEQRIKASEGMKRVWAKRNSLKQPKMLPGQNTPEEKKILWRLRLSIVQIGKKMKPVTDEARTARSEAMKKVWAARKRILNDD